MNAPVPSSHPGWFPDPLGRHEYRWFNGTIWTADVADGGARFVDPYGGGAGSSGTAGPGAPQHRNGIATAAMVCGIIAVATAWMPFFVVAGFVLAVLALVFGIKGVRRSRTSGAGSGRAIAGIVLGAIGLLLSIAGVAFSVSLYRELAAFVQPGDHELVLEPCTVTDGRLTLRGTITNLDDETHEYTLLADIRDGDERGDHFLTVDAVAPGDTADFELVQRTRADTCDATVDVFGPFPYGFDSPSG